VEEHFGCGLGLVVVVGLAHGYIVLLGFAAVKPLWRKLFR
jgi:hypothetical protein